MRRACTVSPTAVVLLIAACHATHDAAPPSRPTGADAGEDSGHQQANAGSHAADASVAPADASSAAWASVDAAAVDAASVDAALVDTRRRDAAGPVVADGGSRLDGGRPGTRRDAAFAASTACLDAITDFGEVGPFALRTVLRNGIRFWLPEVPFDCRVPVIHHANGTGGTCLAYREVLDRLASHGFLTVCSETGQTGAGERSLEALAQAFELYPELAHHLIGTTGHEAGGQDALVTLQQAEAKWGDGYTYAGLAVEPASGIVAQPPGGTWQEVYASIRSPVFMFSGSEDVLVSESWVARGYDALDASVEAYHWSALGATHVPVPQAETMEVAIPWFRWKLLGDAAACRAFKALPSTDRWATVAERNPSDC